MNTGKWIVDVKGQASEKGAPFEISILRIDNIHGRRSYGWFNTEDKILISHSGTGNWPMLEGVFNGLVEFARKCADEANRLEGKL